MFSRWRMNVKENVDGLVVKDSLYAFKITCVLVRLNHVASFIVNANHA
jgi:hypothetical protein